MKNGISDIGIGHISLLHYRYQMVDYTFSLYNLENFLVTSKPQPIPLYQNIIKPLPLEIWIPLIVVSLGVTVLWIIAGYFQRNLVWEVGIMAYKLLFRQSRKKDSFTLGTEFVH